MQKRTIKLWISFLLLAVSILLLVTGYGITNHRLIESITFGLLGKAQSFSLHSSLAIVFIIILAIHIWFFISKPRK